MNPLILIVLAVFVSLILRHYFLNKLKEKAEVDCSELRLSIGADEWKTAGYKQRYLYITGMYNGRTIRCEYYRRMVGAELIITTKPTVVPKKIAWYKPLANHPVIYKDCTLMYNTLYIQRNVQSPLSQENCAEILKDLVYTCELVESGNYNLEK